MLDHFEIDRFVILGSGGGGRTAASIIEAYVADHPEHRRPVVFLDDADQRLFVNDYTVLGPVAWAFDSTKWSDTPAFIVAFGSTHTVARQRTFDELLAHGCRTFNAVHPLASIDRTAALGRGNIVAANCIVHPNAQIGNNCFLCVAVTIDHDDKVGNNAYLSPGVNLGGAVVIEDNVFVGMNAAVLPGVRIGRGAIVGAGAVVTRDVIAGQTVVGVPARPIIKKGELP